MKSLDPDLQPKKSNPLIEQVESWLHRLYIATAGATLREEDRRKAVEVTAILEEIERAVSRLSKCRAIVMVDAAAGKSYVGLLAAQLVFAPRGSNATVIVLENNPRLVDLSLQATRRLQSAVPIVFRGGDVDDPTLWPDSPDIVVGLHACGVASDAIIDRAISHGARLLLLVPCCTSDSVPGVVAAKLEAARRAIPAQAPIRRRFIQLMVDVDRTRRLEAAGYHTEILEFVGPTVTPHNLLWRARLCRPADAPHSR
jgi:hypothetical protein